MSLTDTSANHEWANRPDDERFATLPQFQEFVEKRRANGRETTIRTSRLRLVNQNDDIVLADNLNQKEYKFTNLGIRQLLNRLEVPTAILDPEKFGIQPICDLVNSRIERFEGTEHESNVLFDGESVRSVTSDGYGRIWDAEMVPYFQKLLDNGFKIPPARPARPDQKGVRLATERDVLALCQGVGGGLVVKVGDPIAPAGLYSGNEDSFGFFVKDDCRVELPGGRKVVLSLMIQNSEVGLSGINGAAHGNDYVCGNHLLWGSEQLFSFNIRHRGENVKNRLLLAMHNIQVSDEKFKVWGDALCLIFAWMSHKIMGTTEKEVLENMYELLKGTGVSKETLSEIYSHAEQYVQEDGKPNTLMGFVNAMTRYSQTVGTQDGRHTIDSAAAKVIGWADRQR